MNKAIKNIKKVFYGMKLRTRLALSNYLIVLLTVLGLSLIVSTIVAGSLEQQNAFTVEQSFKQTEDYINYRINNILSTSDTLINSTTLNDILNKDIATYSRREQFVDMTALRQTLSSFHDNQDIYKINVFVDDELIFANDGNAIHSLSTARSAFWWEELTAYRGKVMFVNDWYKTTTPSAQEELLSVLRIMYRQSDYSQIAFVLQLDIRKARLEQTLKAADFSAGSVTYLVDVSGQVVACSSSERTEALQLNQGSLPDASPDGKTTLIQWLDRAFVTLQVPIDGTEWLMVTMIPEADFMGTISRLKISIFWVAAVIMIVSYLSAKWVADSQSRRIYQLCKHIDQNANGAFEEIALDQYLDELSELYQNYNQMLRRLKQLIQENYDIGQELKNMEYRALQSQINPHFLYNTLDMINWLSFSGRSSEVSEVVKSLARFYRLSLSRGRYIVTIQDEIHHVQSYMNIQRIRLENKVDLIIDIPSVLMQYAIPKITLQPIVENALFHGIMEKEEKRGQMRIYGLEGEDCFDLVVEDDGVGFDQQEQPELLAMPQQDISDMSSGSHYGLTNIDKRIKLLCGEGFGLIIKSKRGEGTSVTVRLPKKHIDQMNSGTGD